MEIRIKMRFKNTVRFVLSFVTLMGIWGCQKVINVDLNEASPQMVIEGLINDAPGPYTVTISKSGSYFNQSVLEMVSGTYTLKVISGDQEYDGSSTMFSHVNIDFLMLVKSDSQRFDFGGDNKNHTNVDIHCFFRDPAEKNFYRIKVFRNDTINNDNYRLFDDQYTNGQETELRVANATAGDTFRVELLSLDQATYEYYRTLEDLLHTNPIFGSTPANPNNNLSNGALGYFGACAVSYKTIIVTEAMINSVK
jgi:hypothetical protein